MPPRKRPRKTVRKAKGLTAKERSQVSKIAKGAITQVAEKKFMDSAQFTAVQPLRASTTNDTISCICFSSTTNKSPSGSVLTYGYNAQDSSIREQLCLRPFSVDRGNDFPDADTSNYIIGKECKPVSCLSKWRIARQAASLDSITFLGDSGDVNGSIALGPGQYPSGLAEACPIVCRVVRFVVKNLAGTDTEYNPATDLFVNTRGEKFGVNSNGFDQKEMLAYKVNTRRYTTLDDKVFTLQNPLTVNYTWATQGGNTTTNTGWWVPQVSNGSANCEKYLTMNQMLTQKKHGSVHYPEPISATYDNAAVGQRREFTAFHFMYKGADNLVGASGSLNGPLDVTIDLVNTTKFIDV